MAKADIEVNNRRYSVACAPGQEDRLTELGGKLDGRVRQIADAVGDIGEARLLLIAALAMLDEVENGVAQPVTEVESKAATAIVDAAARINALAERLGSAETKTQKN